MCCKMQRYRRPGDQRRQQPTTADNTIARPSKEREFAAKRNATGGRATKGENSRPQPTTQPPDPLKRVNLLQNTALCVSLYVYLCMCVSVCVSVCVSLYVYLCVYLCISVCLSVCVSIYVCVSVCVSPYVCLCMFVSLCVWREEEAEEEDQRDATIKVRTPQLDVGKKLTRALAQPPNGTASKSKFEQSQFLTACSCPFFPRPFRCECFSSSHFLYFRFLHHPSNGLIPGR